MNDTSICHVPRGHASCGICYWQVHHKQTTHFYMYIYVSCCVLSFHVVIWLSLDVSKLLSLSKAVSYHMKNISSVLIHFLCQGVPVRSSCWCHDGDGWNLWSVWGRWRTQLIIAWSRWGRLKTSWCGTCPYSNTLIVNTHHIRGCRWICEGRLHFIQDHRVHDFHRWKLHQEGTLMQTVFITCYHANKSPYLQCYHFSLGLWWWY